MDVVGAFRSSVDRQPELRLYRIGRFQYQTSRIDGLGSWRQLGLRDQRDGQLDDE